MLRDIRRGKAQILVMSWRTFVPAELCSSLTVDWQFLVNTSALQPKAPVLCKTFVSFFVSIWYVSQITENWKILKRVSQYMLHVTLHFQKWVFPVRTRLFAALYFLTFLFDRWTLEP